MVQHSARGLLYGQRPQGPGPLKVKLNYISWPSFIDQLANQLVSLGAGPQDSLLPPISKTDGQAVRRFSFDLLNGEEVYRVIAVEEVTEKLRGLGVFRLRREPSTEPRSDRMVVDLASSWGEVDFTNLENRLITWAQQHWLNFIEFTPVFDDLLSRYQQGEAVEFAGGSWSEVVTADNIMATALDYCSAYQEDYQVTDEEELDRLIAAISVTAETKTSPLALMLERPIGREILRQEPPIIRLSLD